MDYRVLQAELQLPAYAAMTDAQAATELNAVNKVIPRTVIDAHEIFEAIVPASWVALTADNKQRIGQILAMGRVNVQGANTRQVFLDAFAGGASSNPATRANLAALQNITISRVEQLGLGLVTEVDVQRARSGNW